MDDTAKIAELTSRAACRRQLASHARRLADQITDALAYHELHQYAQELERQAEDFEIEAAVLKDPAAAGI